MAISTVTTVRGPGASGAAGVTQVHGTDRVTVTQVTMDATNYVAGGVPLTAAQLGLQRVFSAACNVVTPAANGPVQCWYDATNAKLKCNAAAAEVGGVSLSGAVIEVTAFGY